MLKDQFDGKPSYAGAAFEEQVPNGNKKSRKARYVNKKIFHRTVRR